MNRGGVIIHGSVKHDLTVGSFKMGNFSRDTSAATGTQAITGLGFTPRFVIFYANVISTPQTSVGMDDGTNAQSVANNHGSVANSWVSSIGAGNSIFLVETGANSYIGHVQSLDSDGFTISWTKTGSKTGTAYINYLAFV